MQTPVIKRQTMLSLFLFTFHFMIFYSLVLDMKHEVAVILKLYRMTKPSKSYEQVKINGGDHLAKFCVFV